MAKRKYITDEEIAKIEADIHNNRNTYMDDWNVEDDLVDYKKRVDKIVLKNEEYVFIGDYIPGDYEHMVLTNYGSCINGKKGNRLRPMFTPNTIHYRIDQHKLDLPKIFKDNQWLYDIEFIKMMHDINDWHYRDRDDYIKTRRKHIPKKKDFIKNFKEK